MGVRHTPILGSVHHEMQVVVNWRVFVQAMSIRILLLPGCVCACVRQAAQADQAAQDEAAARVSFSQGDWPDVARAPPPCLQTQESHESR